MKNLKTLSGLALLLAFLGTTALSAQSDTEPQSTQTQVNNTTPDDPDNPHNPPPPMGLSIDEKEYIAFYEAYPNPTDGIVHLKFNELQPGMKLVVTNIMGQIVMSKELDVSPSEVILDIDLGDLKPGIYVMNVGKQSSKLRVL